MESLFSLVVSIQVFNIKIVFDIKTVFDKKPVFDIKMVQVKNK